MKNLYNFLTHVVDFHLRGIALFNQKLRLGVQGRKQTFDKLSKALNPGDRTIWFHCASLGEYEQGLPVFEAVRSDHPGHKIILSFFSPSGYEIRKDSPIADVVIYLPLDTRKNARKFTRLVNPELVIFVKYEIWPNYLLELKKTDARVLLISALFRKEQTYFKAIGKWMLKAMQVFDHIFVQNEESERLLLEHGFEQVSISGDTRFDRVSKQLDADNQLDFMDSFKGKNLCMVIGSSWPEDEKLLIPFINSDTSDTKYLIAPHNIKTNLISDLIEKLKVPVCRYSEKEKQDMSSAKVFILDTIGLLSKVYAYADIAYVGGAVGTSGLHNTLEPAVFGIPIIIGSNYEKFPEAHEMIVRGGMFSVSNETELSTFLQKLIANENIRRDSGQKNRDYIAINRGAVIRITSYLRK